MEIREKEYKPITKCRHEVGKWYYDTEANVYSFCVVSDDKYVLISTEGIGYEEYDTLQELDKGNVYDIEVDVVFEVSNPYKSIQ